jgi:hypothetical protein
MWKYEANKKERKGKGYYKIDIDKPSFLLSSLLLLFSHFQSGASIKI